MARRTNITARKIRIQNFKASDRSPNIYSVFSFFIVHAFSATLGGKLESAQLFCDIPSSGTKPNKQATHAIAMLSTNQNRIITHQCRLL